MKYPWATPGRKVVCIRDEWESRESISCPVKDVIYTIRDIKGDFSDGVGIRLYELVNPPGHYFFNGVAIFDEKYFNIEGFAPLLSRETDIGIFTALTRQREREFLR